MGLLDKIKKALGTEPEPPKRQQRRRGGQGRGRAGEGRAGEGDRPRSSRSRGGRGGQGQRRGSGQGRPRSGESTGGAEVSERKVTRGSRGGRGRSRGSGSGGGARSSSAQGGEGGSRTRQGQKSSAQRRGRQRQRPRQRRGSSSSGSHRRVIEANDRPKDPVKKQILINASDPNEIRVAIREQQRVVEVYVERKGKRSLAGNIFKGRVQNVLPGMEAAFVDIGLERNGFLYVDEVTPAAADSDQEMPVRVATGGDESLNGDTADASDSEQGAEDSESSTASNGAEPSSTSSSAAKASEDAVDIDAALENGEKEKPAAKPSSRRRKGPGKRKIQELLRPGQELLVQVVKDPMGTKGSRLTTQYSLAGRYLVYVPDGEGLGVSRRLPDGERDRLRDIVKQFETPGGGLIVRTAAEGALEEDIARDLQLLLTLHEKLMEQSGSQRAPKLLYNEADLSLRIIRDLFNDEVESVVVDDKRHYQRIVSYMKRTSPALTERIELYEGDRPLFESYQVEQAIRSTLDHRVDLPSGGYLIIDYAEAFTVIDVNTGRNIGKSSLEETITKTNMEAAEEIVRQLRLRDIGGIIVVDFIDMNMMKNRDAVLDQFRKELSKDRTKTYLVEISPLGLVEMTRQNVSDGVREILTSACTACDGRGVTVSAETRAIDVQRAVIELAQGMKENAEAIAVDVSPPVHHILAGSAVKRREVSKHAGIPVRLFGDPDLDLNSFVLRATGTEAEIEALPEPLFRGDELKVRIDDKHPLNDAHGIARHNGTVITVIGAGADVGEERPVRIDAADQDQAFAHVVQPVKRKRRRGGRGRGKGGADDVGTGTDAAGDVEDADGQIDEAAESEVDVDDEQAAEIPERLIVIGDGDGDSDGEGPGDDLDDDSDDDDDSESDIDDDDNGDDSDEDSDADTDSDPDDDQDDDANGDQADNEPPRGVARQAMSGGSEAAAESDDVSAGGTSDAAGDDRPRPRRRRGSRGGRNRSRGQRSSGAGGPRADSGDKPDDSRQNDSRD